MAQYEMKGVTIVDAQTGKDGDCWFLSCPCENHWGFLLPTSASAASVIDLAEDCPMITV